MKFAVLVLGVHLRKNQTVHCVFKECDFYTNVYGTFASHRSRKHTLHSSSEFRVAQTNITDIAEAHCSEAYKRSGTYDCIGEYETEELNGEEVELNLGHLLLKLESIYNVPSKCIMSSPFNMFLLPMCVSVIIFSLYLIMFLHIHVCLLVSLRLRRNSAGSH